MTLAPETAVARDPFDRRLALRAAGLLRTFNDADVLTAADVHVATRLGVLGGEDDEQVLLAVALATRAVRLGSVCLDLAAAEASVPVPEDGALPWPEAGAWAHAVAASPLVAAGALRWEHDLLYLDRYWQQEVQVCADLVARRGLPPPSVEVAVLDAGVQRVFPDDGYDEQRAAVRRAVLGWTTVLTGGPGTGKTTTVAGLLALLAEQAALTGGRPRIALAAPTGKAAARLQEAVRIEAARLPETDAERITGLEASTLHRLLGSRRDNGTRFRHHRGNRLPHDVVVVDETSMVSLTMMARLLEAVRPDARLVLVGDPDQLASVDAGAVLADLVSGLAGDDGPVAALRTNHRSQAHIIALAEALQRGDADAALVELRAGSDEVLFLTHDDPAPALRGPVLQAALAVREAALAGNPRAALDALDRHRLLCAHRDGPFGVRRWNRLVEEWITEATGDPLWDLWYPGRPVLVTANDYGLGVHNGDVGVTVLGPDGRLRVYVDGATGLLEFAPTRLDDVETMHAMTIHKAQGSQADEVTVLLPGEDSRLLTRELFYTAVTRARSAVRVVGTEESVRAATERRALRATGLRQRLLT